MRILLLRLQTTEERTGSGSWKGKWGIRKPSVTKQYTVELLSNVGASHFVLYREVVLSCTSIIEKGPQSVSFIERVFNCVLYLMSY